MPDFPLWHGFFARTGGFSQPPFESLNTACVTKDMQAEANRELLFRALGIDQQPVSILNPCHGERIAFSDEAAPRKIRNVLVKTDAAFTRTPGTHFLASTGDCISAIFTDSSLSLAGIVHLGWRNLVADFVGKVITAMGERYGLHPDSLQVGMGPLIYPCCYVFRDPVQKDMPFWKPFLKYQEDGNYAVDLASAFRHQLIRSGVPDGNIMETGLCTGCRNDLFFSCYREGYVSGRFPTVLSLQAA